MDFQFELRQEIHRRTQGERERVADYLTCMTSLFDRVIPGLFEWEEVSYAHRNLLPRLHLAVHRADVLEFVHLEVLATAAEKNYRVDGSFRPPPPADRSLIPNLAYRDVCVRAQDRRRTSIRCKNDFFLWCSSSISDMQNHLSTSLDLSSCGTQFPCFWMYPAAFKRF